MKVETVTLKSGNGDMIAPGLYFYSVTSDDCGDCSHIGKFSVVR